MTRKRSHAKSPAAEIPFPRMLSGSKWVTSFQLTVASLADSAPDAALCCQRHCATFCCCCFPCFMSSFILFFFFFLSACCLVSFSNRILLFDLHQGTRSLAQLPHRPAPPPKPRRSKKGVSPRLFTVLLSIFFQTAHSFIKMI